jgi:hypothetical protein
MNADIGEAPVLLDFTGGNLAIFVPAAKDCRVAAMVPFDVVLEPDHTYFGTDNCLMQDDTGEHFKSAIELIDFQRIMGLISNEDAIVRLIWRAFFKANINVLSELVRSSQLVMTVPMSWEPQVDLGLVRGFLDVFGVKCLDICTEAVAFFFAALTRLESHADTWGSQKNTIRVRIASDRKEFSCLFCDFDIERSNKNLYARLVGWEEISPIVKSDNSFEGLEVKIEEVNGCTPAALGYFALQDYLRTNKCYNRIDLDMDIILGVDMGDNFRPLIGPKDRTGKWYGCAFAVSCNEQQLDIPLIAKLDGADKGIFSLTCLTIPQKGALPFSRESTIELQIKKLNFAKACAHLKQNMDSGPLSLDVEFSLPRLYY